MAAQEMSILDEEFIKVSRLFGSEEAVAVVKTLKKIGECTDDAVANDSTVKLNNVRKILYKLYDHGLLSCRRVRDEKTGWFIFFWKLQPEQLDAFIRSRKKRALDTLKKRLDLEVNHSFFACKTDKDIRIPFEEAMESSFKCRKCGNQLDNIDNKGLILALQDRISKLEAELAK